MDETKYIICPYCFSPIGKLSGGEFQNLSQVEKDQLVDMGVYTWRHDPILKSKGVEYYYVIDVNGYTATREANYKGLTLVTISQILDLQNIRRQQEIYFGIPPTEFSPISISPTTSVPKIHKKHLKELRDSTEKILNILGFTLEEYLSYDMFGNKWESQSNWTDYNLEDKTKKLKIRARHIEELRHPVLIKGLIEVFVTTDNFISDEPAGGEELEFDYSTGQPNIWALIEEKYEMDYNTALTSHTAQTTYHNDGTCCLILNPHWGYYTGSEHSGTYQTIEGFPCNTVVTTYPISQGDGTAIGCGSKWVVASGAFLHEIISTWLQSTMAYDRLQYYERNFVKKAEMYVPLYWYTRLGETIILKEAILSETEDEDIGIMFAFLEDINSFTDKTVTLNFKEIKNINGIDKAIYEVKIDDKTLWVTYEQSLMNEYWFPSNNVFIYFNDYCCDDYPDDWESLELEEKVLNYPEYFVTWSGGKNTIWIPTFYYDESNILAKSVRNSRVAGVQVNFEEPVEPLPNNRFYVADGNELLSKDNGAVWFASNHFIRTGSISGSSITLEGKPLLQHFLLAINGEIWSKVDDLSIYDYKAKVFLLDVKGKQVIFGNGTDDNVEGHGMKPSGTYVLQYYADEVKISSWDALTITLEGNPDSKADGDLGADYGYLYKNSYSVDITYGGEDPIHTRRNRSKLYTTRHEILQSNCPGFGYMPQIDEWTSSTNWNCN